MSSRAQMDEYLTIQSPYTTDYRIKREKDQIGPDIQNSKTKTRMKQARSKYSPSKYAAKPHTVIFQYTSTNHPLETASTSIPNPIRTWVP